MKINKQYSQSLVARVLGFLFGPENYGLFGETLFGKLFSFNFHPLGEAFLLASFVLLLLKTVFPSAATVVPIFLILAALFLDKSKVKISKSIIWVMIFFFFVSVSALWGVFLGLPFAMISVGWLLWLQFVLLLFIGTTLKTERVLRAIPILIFPVSAYGIYQYFFSNLKTTLWVSDLENIPLRAFSVVADPNVFGMISAIALMAALVMFLKGRKIYLISIVVSAVAVILSYSRTTWLSLGVALLLAIVLKYRKLIFFAPLALLSLFVGKIRERILVTFNPAFLNSSSLDGRIWIANNVTYIWKKSPIFGFGPGSYGGMIAREFASPVYRLGLQGGYVALYFTDGQWLEVLIQLGIMGVVSLFGFFASIFWAFYGSFRKNQDVVFLGGLMFLAFLITSGFTSNIIEFSLVIMPISLILGSVLNEA